MSNFFNDFVVGVDVSSKSSVVTILMPSGEAYGKKISMTNDLKGFDKLLLILTDITENFSKRPKIFMESTELYHIPLLNYFSKNNFKCYVINPIHTKNFAKQSIRKVKNDKVDSLRIAQFAQFPTFSNEFFFDEDIFLLKKLCREYDSLVSHRAHYKKKVLSSLNLVFLKFNDIFSDTFSAVPLAILSNYPTYKDFLSTHKSDVVTLIRSTVSHSSEWADKKYNLIYNTAKEAEMLKLPTTCLGTELACFINVIKTFSKSIDDLKEQILIFRKQIPNFEDNAKFLCTHPEVGLLSAISFLAEIGDIKNFSSPKKLVAFLGVDTSVSQSGTFTSTHNKLTKRVLTLPEKYYIT
jgi:hypothetical protein